MAWSFSASKPVYLQIADRIKKAVLSGKYPAGEQIPSVRQLALEAAVNPNTVQHAFTELENEGIILSHGTMGRFVTDDMQILELCRKKMAQELTAEFLKDISALSIDREHTIQLIKEVDS